jgi:hypothetical protein
MSRDRSLDSRPAVRPALIATAALALLPIAPAEAHETAYDAKSFWQHLIVFEPIWEAIAQHWNPAAEPMLPAEPPLPPTPPADSKPPPVPPAPAATGTVTVSWDVPTERVDDSPLENLAGFRVYYGTAPGAYTSKLEVNAPRLTSVVISSLPAGTYWFVVTAYDSEGLESVYSEPASKYVAS